MANDILEAAKKLNALADVGLLYCKNEYDHERYAEIKSLAIGLFEQLLTQPPESIARSFPPVADYPTAKVDIRALVLSPDQKILLTKESADGKWSLPGGWADVGYSPKEVAVKECREETGLDVSPQRLLAVFDKRLHPHPPQPFYVYKLVILCSAVSTEIKKGFDVLDVQYFPLNELPELSQDRILKSQIELCLEKALTPGSPVHFD